MKKLKTHIIKFTAIVISMIYLLMPIHKEVKITLHNISHFLEMPNVILSHNHNENLNYKVKSSTITYHEHKILDLLDALTNTDTSTKDSNKPYETNNKIDKHFHSLKYTILNRVSTKSVVFYNYKEKLNNYFLKKIKRPPEKIKMQLS